ncbi:hypothetical protein [Methanococcoides methylutens]|nr:hypothetical protein [Methanococcoides methylutens]
MAVVEDVDGEGDLVVHFRVHETGINSMVMEKGMIINLEKLMLQYF